MSGLGFKPEPDRKSLLQVRFRVQNLPEPEPDHCEPEPRSGSGFGQIPQTGPRVQFRVQPDTLLNRTEPDFDTTTYQIIGILYL